MVMTAEMLGIDVKQLQQEAPGHPKQMRIRSLIDARTTLHYRYWNSVWQGESRITISKIEVEYLKVCRALARLTAKPTQTYITLFDRRGF
jgi:hypothetical protein